MCEYYYLTISFFFFYIYVHTWFFLSPQVILSFSHWPVYSLLYSSFRILHSLVSDPIYCSNSFTCFLPSSSPLFLSVNLSFVGGARLEKTTGSKNGSGWPCVKQHIPYVTPGLILPLIYATAKRPNRRSWEPVNADHCGLVAISLTYLGHPASPFCLAGSRECKCHWRRSVARRIRKLVLKSLKQTTAKIFCEPNTILLQ